jgi:hypothetical protein
MTNATAPQELLEFMQEEALSAEFPIPNLELAQD